MATTEPFVDIVALSSFLISIGSYHMDLVFTPQSKLSQGDFSLYHYTDLSGFMGIVKNHDLWLSHSLYSNDAEEMVHGSTVVKNVIEKALTNKAYDEVYLQELSKLTSTPEGVYICCFCEKDNLLSQWRGYAAYGSGVSLKFGPNEFTAVSGPDNQHGLLRFWRVFYKPDTQTKIIESALSHYSPAMNIGQGPQELARQAADAVRFFIPTFKNMDFEEEDEWRLIFTPAPTINVQPQFRIGRNMLVPYYSLRELIGTVLPRLPLQGVCVGPSVHKQINAKSVEALLQREGYNAVKVTVSNTSYRA